MSTSGVITLPHKRQVGKSYSAHSLPCVGNMRFFRAWPVVFYRPDKSEFGAPKGAISRESDRANVHVIDSERSREGAQAPSVRVSVSERSREP